MMGIEKTEPGLFYEFSLNHRVPHVHLLRRFEQAVEFLLACRALRFQIRRSWTELWAGPEGSSIGSWKRTPQRQSA
jgi:hypothetical protein